jgi:phosphatidylserine/phosphatidylglycerophosphate/cardiolipin synthase-like enzyme
MRYLIPFLFFISTAHAAPVEVCFVPSTTSCTDLAVKQIAAAKTSIYLMAYSFTSKPIELALVAAAKRGVKVEVILDKSNVGYKYSGSTVMVAAGIPTTIDDSHAIAHNKIVIIDESVVLGGSFNYTNAAQKSNAENMTVTKDAKIAALYLANWKLHRAHAKDPKDVAPPPPRHP